MGETLQDISPGWMSASMGDKEEAPGEVTCKDIGAHDEVIAKHTQRTKPDRIFPYRGDRFRGPCGHVHLCLSFDSGQTAGDHTGSQ